MTTIFLNVETVPADAFIGQALPPAWAYDATVQPPPERKAVPRNLVDPAKIAAKLDEYHDAYEAAKVEHSADWAKRAAKLWEKGSLDPLKARIIVGVVAVDDGDPVVLPDEHILGWLETHWDVAHEYAAYNCGFDRQMIFAAATRGTFPETAREMRQRRWVDPGEVFRALGSRWYGQDTFTLNAMCAAFGVTHNPAFTGADVLPAYLRGDLPAIHAHCLDRVTALRELYWKVCP